jgi:hypothetical protein
VRLKRRRPVEEASTGKAVKGAAKKVAAKKTAKKTARKAAAKAQDTEGGA